MPLRTRRAVSAMLASHLHVAAVSDGCDDAGPDVCDDAVPGVCEAAEPGVCEDAEPDGCDDAEPGVCEAASVAAVVPDSAMRFPATTDIAVGSTISKRFRTWRAPMGSSGHLWCARSRIINGFVGATKASVDDV